ncbi:MAG TPA: M28 family peptidase, partial [Vicinamibacteria bacterium]|nr:M28 family peptidase [Vicinamibacteria bacterium]
MSKKALPFLALTAAAVAALAQVPNPFDGKTWWTHVEALASDAMEGRETGSPGLARAEAYIVDQLMQAGLQPAGEKGGYYQTVRLESRQLVESDSSAALVRDGHTEPVRLGEEAIFSTRVDLAPEVEAPLVFLGYGLRVPEKQHDDLAGLDLSGKVAVVFSGAPDTIPGPLAAHYQTTGERWKALHAAGAVGVVGIPNPAAMDVPWSRIALNRLHPSMELADPVFDETAGERLAMVWNPAAAERLFAGSGHTFAEIAALGRERKPLPRFPLAVSIRAKTHLRTQPVESANVVAALPGSDPALKQEYVVLSAHADHIGIGEPIAGDRIYNGAMDNASGCAVLLDVAASLRRSPRPLRRSLLFLFATGEEKGLLGSRYFAHYPTVPIASMVADVNVDMFLPLFPLKLLTVWGIDESDLGDLARQTAATRGVRVQADPEPQRNVFIRSDQYNFIRRGVPALMMGVAPDSDAERKTFTDWLTHRYHAPSDDLAQPVDLQAATGYEAIVRDLMVAVADDPRRPEWKADSFFRRFA